MDNAARVWTKEKAPAARAGVWGKPIAVGLTVLFLVYGALVLGLILTTPEMFPRPGTDRDIYVAAGQRWLAGEWVYYPEQLAGPYELATGHVLYPPPAYPFFALASFLPAVLWWLVPFAIVGGVIAWHRPRYWAWPLIAACLGFQWTVMIAWTGNPTLWVAACVALATLRGGWAVAVLAKPTLAPFALVGIRRRSWWITLAAFATTCLLFGTMWLDWFTVIRNAYGPMVRFPFYSLGDVPLLLAPVIASLAATRAQPGARR